MIIIITVHFAIVDNQLLQRQLQYPVTPANRKVYQNFHSDDQFSSFSEESETFEKIRENA